MNSTYEMERSPSNVSMTTNCASLNSSNLFFTKKKNLKSSASSNSLLNKNLFQDCIFNNSLRNNIENRISNQMKNRVKSPIKPELNNLISYSYKPNEENKNYNNIKLNSQRNSFNRQNIIFHTSVNERRNKKNKDNNPKLTYEFLPELNKDNYNEYINNKSINEQNILMNNINHNNNNHNFEYPNQQIYNSNLDDNNNPIYNIPNDSYNMSPDEMNNNSQNIQNISNSNGSFDLNNELQKANNMINLLKQENESLILQRDSALNHIKSIENQKNFNEEEFKELEDQIQLYKQKLDLSNQNLSNLNNENSQLRHSIKELNDDLYTKDNIIQKLNNDIKIIHAEKDKIINDLNEEIEQQKNFMKQKNEEYERNNNILNNQIKNLEDTIAEEKLKNQKLQIYINNMNKIDENTKKLLEYLFDFYNNIRELFMSKWKKDILLDIIEFEGPDEFNKNKLLILLDKLKQFLEDLKMKFGKCFACDIACCTSEYDRLKFFRKYYPGIPKNLKIKK